MLTHIGGQFSRVVQQRHEFRHPCRNCGNIRVVWMLCARCWPCATACGLPFCHLRFSGRYGDRPTQSQQCLNDEENVTTTLMTTPPLSTPADDSRSFGFLVDATTPLTRTHSSQVDRQCLGQSTSEGCLDLSLLPSSLVVPCMSRSTTHPLTIAPT